MADTPTPKTTVTYINEALSLIIDALPERPEIQALATRMRDDDAFFSELVTLVAVLCGRYPPLLSEVARIAMTHALEIGTIQPMRVVPLPEQKLTKEQIN